MLEPGTQIARYEIQRRLGRGGTGTVYVAHDPVLGRMVAIKVFSGDLDVPEAQTRFTREARAAAVLNHPHIVTIYEYGEHESGPYIVMEYVPGETLAALIRRKAPVPFTDKLRWIEELSAGAEYAHQMSVLHRDIKPSNLIVDRAGRLKILDFGIARLMHQASTTGAGAGTPGYTAPEQIRGSDYDRRADVFSIGVVFYELLTYREAFSGETAATIAYKILSAAPPPITEVLPDLDPEVVSAVTRALEKEPAHRFDSADALRRTIARIRARLDSELPVDRTVIADRTLVKRDDTGTQVLVRTPPPVPERPSATGPAPAAPPDWVPTPKTPTRHTDREEIARRREEQVRAALDRGWARLGQGDLQGAQNACEEALTFNEHHTGALRLEEALRRAHEETEERVRRPSAPALPAIDRQAGTATAAASAAPRSARAATGTPVAPRKRLALPALPALRPALLQSVRANSTVVAAAAVAAVLVAAVVIYLLTRPAAPIETGTLVLDATPWARIAAIVTEGGDPVEVPPEASTPLFLTLPAGSYDVELTGPPPESRTERVRVQVDPRGTILAPVVRFEGLTVEQYFEPYLQSAVEGAAGEDPPEPGIAVEASSGTADVTAAASAGVQP